jgi:DNA-binding NtrC family response regulator
VRELENLVERLVVTCEGDVIRAEDLPHYILERDGAGPGAVVVHGVMPLAEALRKAEDQLLMNARKMCRTTYEMARVLQVNQSTVVRKLKRLSKPAS